MMEKKFTPQIVFFLLFSMVLSISLKAQVPNFTLTDIYGVEHNLYEDYLDQGKTVLLSFGATWNPWDEVWMESGALQEFQEDYVTSGQAAILFIDPYSPSFDDLLGTTGNSTGYNFIDNTNFPIISTTEDILIDFEVIAFPSIRMICPDGSGYSDGFSQSTVFTIVDNLAYTNLETADIIAERMFEHCGASFDLNSIEGLVYNDEDDNCIHEQNEVGVAGIKSIITGPNGTVTRISNQNGIFRRIAVPGDYSVTVVPPNDLWSVCNSPTSITFNNGPTVSEHVDFGLNVFEECPKLISTITAPILRRCFDANLYVDYCNEGTVHAENVILTVVLDEYMDYVSANMTPSSVDGQTITFEIGNLDPLECGKITITFFTDCEVELETEQCYSSQIAPVYDCDDGRLVIETECQEIRGAFDPNDKRAFPLSGSDDYIVEPNTMIKYQIRFQNTGSDTAFNVFIEDVISDDLDINSFRVGASSHYNEIEFDENRKMVIRFPNIMLPDSNVNLVGSNGFVNYYINQVPNLNNGVVIENSAGIFFDFNDPVLTNTTRHTIDDGVSSISNLNTINFSIFPNPASTVLDIRINEKGWNSGVVDILDVTGKLMQTQTLENSRNEIEVHNLEEGIYFLVITNNLGHKTSELLSIIR